MAAKLSWPQRNMLERAAADTDGEHTVRLGPGEPRTAKSLQALGYGYYHPTGAGHRGNPARFVINNDGRKALEPDTETVWVGNLSEGDKLVVWRSASRKTTYPAITGISVDGGYLHVRLDEGDPITFFKGDRVRRVVRT